MSVNDPTQEESYIIYLDANNLYGWSMSRYLQTKDFKWKNDNWTKEEKNEYWR